MKKEFIDFLYEQRFKAQQEIDKLVEQDKQPRDANCSGCGDTIKSRLEAFRLHIQSINKSIEKYFETHAKF